MWFLNGHISSYAFMPFGVIALLLVIRLFAQVPSFACAARLGRALCQCTCAALFLLLSCTRFLMREPSRIVHPLEAGPHFVIISLSGVLFFAAATNKPAMLLWSAHTIVAVLVFLENVCVRRFAW